MYEENSPEPSVAQLEVSKAINNVISGVMMDLLTRAVLIGVGGVVTIVAIKKLIGGVRNRSTV